MRFLKQAAVFLAVAALASGTHAQTGVGDVVYVPTPQLVVDEMLLMGKVNKNDYLIDLGSGDGRFVITAAKKHGAKALGVDLDTYLLKLANEAARSSRMKHCFITNSGCMANEAALKLCQQKTNAAPRIIAFHDCFMGRSTTMSQIGDTSAYRQGIALNILVDYLPFFDAEMGVQRSIDMTLWHLEQLIHRYPGQHCCLIAELVQGEGGFNTAPREFFVALFEAAKKAGIPIWDDEVQSFGRTESMFCFERLDLGQYIDVVTVGKITQACACLYTADFNPKAGLLSGTFAASTSAFATGLSILRRLQSGGYYGPDGKNAKLFAAFKQHADAFVAEHPEWFTPVTNTLGRTNRNFVAGTGGMMRLTPFGGSREKIGKLLNNLFEDGVIAFSCGHGPYHLRLLPPVGVMKPEQFTPVFEIMAKSFARTN